MNILRSVIAAVSEVVDSLDGTDLDAIGRRIAAAREALGYNQRQFAQVCDLSPQSLNNYETGIRRPQIEAAGAMSRVFSSKLDWIYFGDRGSLPADLAAKIFGDPRRQTA